MEYKQEGSSRRPREQGELSLSLSWTLYERTTHSPALYDGSGTVVVVDFSSFFTAAAEESRKDNKK